MIPLKGEETKRTMNNSIQFYGSWGSRCETSTRSTFERHAKFVLKQIFLRFPVVRWDETSDEREKIMNRGKRGKMSWGAGSSKAFPNYFLSSILYTQHWWFMVWAVLRANFSLPSRLWNGNLVIIFLFLCANKNSLHFCKVARHHRKSGAINFQTTFIRVGVDLFCENGFLCCFYWILEKGVIC